LALTGNSDAATLERCTQVGMNGHMSKPVDPATLREKILAALSGAATQATNPPRKVEDPLARVRSIATAARNPALLDRLVAAFIKSTEDGLAQTSPGQRRPERGCPVGHVPQATRLLRYLWSHHLFPGRRQVGRQLTNQELSQCSQLLDHLFSLWPPLRSQLENSGGTPEYSHRGSAIRQRARLIGRLKEATVCR